MYGPYTAVTSAGTRSLAYLGNRRTRPIADVLGVPFRAEMVTNRVVDLANDAAYHHLHKIDNALFFATVDYFRRIGAEWCNLPLTTLMISSPGEVYAGQKLDYTTDTLPIELDWFDGGRRVFLAESSQFYLELRLLVPHLERVFSIYNSFRKERADASHLSEFQHVEFEGRVGFEENLQTALGLMRHITRYILEHNVADLRFFLEDEDVESLAGQLDDAAVERLTFREALALLYRDTGDAAYKQHSMQHFGAWEEVRLTQILGRHALLTEFPLLQIPFYHDIAKVGDDGVPLANNADLILYGYREVVGAGVRIRDIPALQEKARQFNLPLDDYEPYLQSRRVAGYQQTAGFGMG
jgi:aspartyl/asparaginyl-tRNA synthetase